MSLYDQASKTTGSITADAVVSATPCLITGITLRSGTGASSLVLYDNATAASGTIVWSVSLIATTAAGDQTHSITFPYPLACTNGCYVDWTGTAAIGNISFLAN